MILNQINWDGPVDVNGTKYDNMQAAIEACKAITIESITLLKKEYSVTGPAPTKEEIDTVEDNDTYVIEVKGYMTKPAQPGFDFMQKWNNNNPMPLRVMVGTIEKETKGMVYMKLHGDITAKIVPICMKCGKPLTNPVSQFFGMGPECGGHNYVNPFNSEEELQQAVEKYRTEYLSKITWEGWIIKSAIIKQEVYNGRGTES